MLSGNIHARGKKLYSQYDEELIVRDFFDDERGGIFVDVGCADYKHHSTTFFLEKHLGWSGVALDARAEAGEGFRRFRPRTKFFNFIVTDHADSSASFFTAISSPYRSSTKKWVASLTGEVREKKVPTTTLDRVLKGNGVRTIDFLSVDVELEEVRVLRGFDIERFRPRLVCIEAAPPVRKQIIDYFAKHRYQLIVKYLADDWVNLYFAPVQE